MYKNKTHIGIQLIRYYTYVDEYLSAYFNTAHTNIIYINNDSTIVTTKDINQALMNMSKFPNNKFIIVKNFIVKTKDITHVTKSIQDELPEQIDDGSIKVEECIDENNKPSLLNTLPQNIYKTFYDIYYLSDTTNMCNTLTNNIKSNIIKNLFDVHLDIRLLQTYANINDELFCNQIKLFENMMDWDCPLIAASLTINDSTSIYNFNEYDMTPFFVSVLRPNSILNIDNTMKNKKLWITVFNYMFKFKHILIPDSSLENLELFWTIVFDDGNIMTGTEIKIEL
tara:strand:- start:976 stop:1824 length:849 start_codon:yes stop_codon:yes gene_type:complete